MKIKITYLPGEEEAASNIKTFAFHRLGADNAGVRVRESENNPPFKHIYLSTKKPGNASGTRESS